MKTHQAVLDIGVWLDISLAPKNGRRILVFDGRCAVEAYWGLRTGDPKREWIPVHSGTLLQSEVKHFRLGLYTKKKVVSHEDIKKALEQLNKPLDENTSQTSNFP